jgi:uncharacterized protein
MGRILFFVLLAVAAYVGWQWLRRPSRTTVERKATPPSAQMMVSCAHCGLHLPRQDALPAGAQFFCCEDHRQRGSTR